MHSSVREIFSTILLKAEAERSSFPITYANTEGPSNKINVHTSKLLDSTDLHHTFICNSTIIDRNTLGRGSLIRKKSGVRYIEYLQTSCDFTKSLNY